MKVRHVRDKTTNTDLGGFTLLMSQNTTPEEHEEVIVSLFPGL